MLVKVFKFDKQKYINNLEFWNSEFKKGHIDLIHPKDKSIPDYFHPCEIETTMFKTLTSYTIPGIFEIDNDYLIHDILIDNRYYSFSDYCSWMEIKGIELKGDIKNLYREYKIKKIIG